MAIKKTSLIIHFIIAFAIALIVVLFFSLSQRNNEFSAAASNRFYTILLVDELRKSSEELTRQVQLYAATGKAQAEEAYNKVLAVRGGQEPRPHSAYIAPGEKRVLLELLKEHGITGEEFSLVEKANALSDELVALEIESMNAVKGIFKDGRGEYTVRAAPDRELALGLVFSDSYFEEVRKIMAPMDEFQDMVYNRTARAMHEAEAQQKTAERIAIAAVVLIFLAGSYAIARYARDLQDVKALVDEIHRENERYTIKVRQQAEAEAANNAKSSFLSTMSHEMRTPMNAVIGMTTIGLKAADIERKNYALNRIESASRHLLGIINDVLDISKIEANKLELSPIPFSLNHSLEKAVSLIQFIMEEKQIHFFMNVGDNTPRYLIGDDQRLTQVIMNLLSNAAKFTPKYGSIKLDVSFLSEENGICELCFEVADSGIGISPEQQEKIFHPFEQAESGTTRKFGGTGLGLVITKRIIELMGGIIWVESEIGNGSRFIFTVKMPRDENGPLLQKDLPDAEETAMDDAPVKFKDKKLLIVEDIEINREILISLLEDTELLIETAGNGKEALDMVAAAPDKYDLIFMDMQMPVMDGLEATRQIRLLPPARSRKLPIIAMTANVFQEDIEKCHAAGMDDHVGKPLELAKVLNKLREYLNA